MRLGAACIKIGSGATPRGGSDVYLQSGPYALIRSQNIYNDGFHYDGLAFIGEEHAAELENVEVLKDDVLLNITGDSVARACQVDPSVLPARVNQHVAIIRPDPNKLAPRFLRYVLVSPEMQTKLLSWAGSGGTRNALTKGMVESFEVIAPPDIAEQRAIARILGTLDDKIELNRQMNDTLEAMARALFKSWFVDFDPVRAKQPKNVGWVSPSGRNPPDKADGGLLGYAANPPYELPPHIADLFPDRLVDSELGQIPEGWQLCSFSNVCDTIFSGGTPSTMRPDYWCGGIPWLSSGETRSKFIVATEKTITSKGVTNSSTRLARAGATVIASAGQGYTRGQTSMLMFDSYINQSVVVLQADPRYTSNAHLFFDLERRYEQFRQVSDAHSSRGSLTTKLLANLRVVVPPCTLIEAFDNIAVPIVLKIAGALGESRTLAALRDALLPKLITGELRVKDAERVAVGET
ncbi:MAG: restriction endonuclease subunit S [Gammaproteobacteria bacterium]